MKYRFHTYGSRDIYTGKTVKGNIIFLGYRKEDTTALIAFEISKPTSQLWPTDPLFSLPKHLESYQEF